MVRATTPKKSPRASASPAPASRKSASPAPASRKSASPAPSAKKAATPKKSAAASSSAEPEPEEVAPAATSAVPAPAAKANGKGTNGSAAVAAESPGWMAPLAIFGVLIALLAGAALWPLADAELEPLKVDTISSKVFSSESLSFDKEKVSTSSSLVVFTYNASHPPACEACKELDNVIRTDAFKMKNAAWKRKNVLSVYRVQCNKKDSNKELCARFSGVVGSGVDKPAKITKLSASAFDGKELKTSFAGNSLVLFTNEPTSQFANQPSCAACDDLELLTESPAFQRKVAAWKARDVLRIGKVYCNKHAELCESLGVAGSAGSEPGLPHVLWYKGGVEQGAYEGGHSTAEQFDAWAFEHSLPHVLWLKSGEEASYYDGGRSSVDDFHKWVQQKQDVGEL